MPISPGQREALLAVLGVSDLGQRLAGGGLGALRQAIQHVGHFVDVMPISA
jgi:hypothetical protein